jgi:hypothetical protein
MGRKNVGNQQHYKILYIRLQYSFKVNYSSKIYHINNLQKPKSQYIVDSN